MADPCRKKFDLKPTELYLMGLNTLKRYGLCLDGERPNKGRILICPCNGCGPRCPGYETEESPTIASDEKIPADATK